MANRNELAFRLRRAQSNTYFDYGALRRARNFNYDNYERAVNDVTSRTTSSASQRLAVSQGLGLNTSGLIIGGQRDGRTPQERYAESVAQDPSAPYGRSQTTGEALLPGTGTKKKPAPPPKGIPARPTPTAQ